MSDPRMAEIASRYSIAATTYDALWSPIIRPKSAPLFQALSIPRSARVLDVGCGTGILSEDVRAIAPDATVVGLDISAGMASATLSLGRELGVTASADRAPLADGSFDIVFSVFVLQHLPDPIAAVAEMGRLVRPRGIGATVTWGPMKDSYAEEVIDQMLDDAGMPPPDRPIDTAELLDAPEKVAAAWERAGLHVERAWIEQSEHRWTPDGLIDIVTGYGRSKMRFDRLEESVRKQFIVDAYERLATMSPEALTWRPFVVFSIARR